MVIAYVGIIDLCTRKGGHASFRKNALVGVINESMPPEKIHSSKFYYNKSN